MDDTRLGAGDMQLFASERLNLGVLVERLVEHIETYLRSLQYIERLHNDHVHQSVAHRCLWSDIGVVAILRCVGTRDEEGLVLLCSRLVLEGVGFRLILQSFSQNVLSIADGSSFAAFGKLHAYEGVKSHTAGTEERIAVDDPIVEVVNLALVDDLNTLFQVHGQHEVTSQSVARSTRQNSQGCVGVYDGSCHFVDSTVTSHSHHNVNMSLLRLGSNFRCVSGSFRSSYLVLKAVLVQNAIYQVGDGCFACRARDRIHDKNDLLLHLIRQNFMNIQLQK